MGNRSGRRLTNSQKKQRRIVRLSRIMKKNRKRRENKLKPYPVPVGLLEVYNGVKHHILKYVKDRCRYKIVKKISDSGLYLPVLAVRGKKCSFSISKMTVLDLTCSLDVIFYKNVEDNIFPDHVMKFIYELSEPNFFEKLEGFLTVILSTFDESES